MSMLEGECVCVSCFWIQCQPFQMLSGAQSCDCYHLEWRENHCAELLLAFAFDHNTKAELFLCIVFESIS